MYNNNNNNTRSTGMHSSRYLKSAQSKSKCLRAGSCEACSQWVPRDVKNTTLQVTLVDISSGFSLIIIHILLLHMLHFDTVGSKKFQINCDINSHRAILYV